MIQVQNIFLEVIDNCNHVTCAANYKNLILIFQRLVFFLNIIKLIRILRCNVQFNDVLFYFLSMQAAKDNDW